MALREALPRYWVDEAGNVVGGKAFPAFTNDFMTEVEKGNISGHSTIHKFGRNSNVSTTLVPIVNGGTWQTPQTAAIATLALISDDANDTAAGTGAREVTIVYLDVTGAEQTGTIATNGIVESTETIVGVLRLLRAFVSASGTYATATAGSQKGSITIRVAGAGAQWAVIPEVGTSGFAVSQGLIGAYTVPLGFTAYILSYSLSVDSGKTADIYFFARENILETAAPYSAMRLKNLYVGLTGVVQLEHFSKERYEALTDIGFMAKVDLTAADVSVEFEILLVQDGF